MLSLLAGAAWARQLRVAPRAIFGEDDRHEVYAVSDPRLRAAAEGVALLIDNHDLRCDVSGTTCELGRTTPLFVGDACADEPFATQPTAGFCTGFLIASDLLATAGHCIEKLRCPFTAFVFGFAITEPDGAAKAAGLETFRCAEVIESVTRTGYDDGLLQDGADYAVVRLDRPVTGRTPLVVRRERVVAVGEPLVVIGYPFVLPLKVAGGAEVQSVAGTYFQATLDISGGNSGSPVLDRDSLEVVDVLVRGAPDSYVDFANACVRSARYRDADGWLGWFSQATHAALLPAVESCLGTMSCPASITTATCGQNSWLDVHYPFCRECFSDRRGTRKVGRNVERALQLLQRGEIDWDFDLVRAERALRQALGRLEGAASQLERTFTKGRVSPQCDGALRSVIDELRESVRFDLDLLAVLKASRTRHQPRPRATKGRPRARPTTTTANQ